MPKTMFEGMLELRKLSDVELAAHSSKLAAELVKYAAKKLPTDAAARLKTDLAATFAAEIKE